MLSLLLVGPAFAPPRWSPAPARGAAAVHHPRAAALAMNGRPLNGAYARGGDDESLGAPVDARRVESLVADRNAYRRERRFDEADAVRAELRDMNVKLHDKEKMWVVGNSPPLGGRGPQQQGGYDDRGPPRQQRGGYDDRGPPRQQRGGYDDRGPPQRSGYGDGGSGGYGARDGPRSSYDRSPRSGAYGQGDNGQGRGGYGRSAERSPSSYGRMADRYADSSPGTRYGNPRGGGSGERDGGGERGGRYGGGGAAERGGSNTRGGRGGGSYGRDGDGYGREGVGYGGRDERRGGYDDRSADQSGQPDPNPNRDHNSSPTPDPNPSPNPYSTPHLQS
jgi:hypothetical protein